MHRTITILVCLLILLMFPRIASEEAKEKKTPQNNADTKLENITVIITEVKPMASELTADDGNKTTENPIQSNVTETNTTTTTTTTTATTETDSKTEETKIVELNVTTSKPDNLGETKDIVTLKQITVDKLKEEIVRAKEDLAGKVKRLEEIKRRTNVVQDLSVRANDHLRSLIFALNSLQGSLIQSSKAAFETDWQFQLQTAMHNEAKRKYVRLLRELEMTKADYERTKVAAENAMMAAKIAQRNAHTMEPTSGVEGKIFIGRFSTGV